MPVKVSPKFWAEHMGMPYHQADIRDQEVPHGKTATGLMALSAGSRSFTRYGYADLLREDRRYGVLHRIWPGTQRLLLWGDPVTAAAYSRAFQFCGSSGVEIFEPLSFKGRRGSGIGGQSHAGTRMPRCGRGGTGRNISTRTACGAGCCTIPQADPNTWQRATCRRPAESALANASRILPIITTAHGPSAANNTYWPEIYTNQPIVDPRKKNPYTDTPSPKTFGNVSPFDPQLFSRVNDFAGELIKGERSGKYSPVEVAQWLEDLADKATRQSIPTTTPELHRLAIDVGVEAGIGRFFGAKLRSAVLFGLFEQTGDRGALEEALKQYRRARDIWAQIVEHTKAVYVPDITVGELAWLRGHWSDRLPAIDDDIADMQKALDAAKPDAVPAVRAAIAEVIGRPRRATATCRHTPPAKFQPSQALPLEISVDRKLASARLYYRHVNQAERYQTAEMQAADNRYRAAIPAAYTDSPFPLVYYFELKEAPGQGVAVSGLRRQVDRSAVLRGATRVNCHEISTSRNVPDGTSRKSASAPGRSAARGAAWTTASRWPRSKRRSTAA